MTDVAALAARLSPAQRHVVLRGSDAEVWGWQGGEGYSHPRYWVDLVHGRRHVGHSTLEALHRLGIYEEPPADVFGSDIIAVYGWWRLTRLGLAVQLELRMRLHRGAW